MKRLSVVAAVCAATVSLLAAGCSGVGEGGPVKLTFQSLAFQDSTVAATADIVAQWNRANPDVQVEILQSNYDDVHDQLVTQFQSDTAPDLIYDEASDIAGFAHQGYLADLSTYLSDELKNAVDKEFWDITTIGGKVVAVPTLVQSYVAFVNTDALAAAGVAMPSNTSLTWDELRALAKRLTADGRYGVGWGLKQPASAVVNTALAYGGGFFDVEDDGSASISVGDGELAVPDVLRNMLIDDKSMDPVAATQSTADTVPGFFAGKYAIFMGASYLAQQLTSAAPAGFNFTVLPPLAGSKGTAQAANPQTLSIAAQSRHPQEAAQFLDFYMNADNQARLAESDWLRPVSRPALERLAANTANKPIWKPLLAATEGLRGAPFTKTLNYPQWKLQYLTPGLQKYFAGRMSRAELAASLTDGWKSIGR